MTFMVNALDLGTPVSGGGRPARPRGLSYCDPMLIAGVLCLCAAAVIAGLGVRALARPAEAAGSRQVLRAVAPTQLAAAMMLAAGGAVALSGRASIGLLVLIKAITAAPAKDLIPTNWDLPVGASAS